MTQNHIVSLFLLAALALLSFLVLMQAMRTDSVAWRIAAAATGTSVFVTLGALVFRDGFYS